MQKPYTFIMAGKLLEHDSLIQLRVEVPEADDWELIVAQTIDFYFQLEAIHKSKDMELDSKDIRVMRSLRRTIAFIKKMDPITHGMFYSAEVKESYKQAATTEIDAIRSIKVGYGKKPDGHSDIVVSNLDG